MDLDPNADRFHAVFDIAPLGIAIADRHGGLLEANPAFLAMFGCTRQEVLGRSFIDLAHPEERDRIAGLVQSIRDGRADSYQAEKRCIRRDGGEFWAEVRCTALRDGKGDVTQWVGIVEDVSARRDAEWERRRLAAQLQQARKMEAVATRAGGIAHDFNNLLMGIQGNISLLLLDKAPDHRDVAYLKNVEKSVMRASELTRQILGFARDGKHEVRAVAAGGPPEKTADMPGRARREIAILLVEDEEMVANIGRQMLERLGHRVVVAQSGDEALALYEKRRAEIDLVILDMIMPGMGGGAVFDRIRAIHPQAAVLLSSGYSLNGQALEIMKRGCRGFIQKPFSIEQLKQKIGEILSSAQDPPG
jgi:PAS domain S-box-containing protein